MSTKNVFAALSTACESRMAELDYEAPARIMRGGIESAQEIHRRRHILADLAAVFALAGDQLSANSEDLAEEENEETNG